MEEPFIYSDKFYSDVSDFIEDVLDEYKEDLSDLPDDYSVICNETVLEPIINFNKGWMYDRIDDERLPEDENSTMRGLEKALDLIPFDDIMKVMPKLYYESRKKFTLTKKDLLEYIN